MARGWFGDAFVDHFAATREWEEREFRNAITDRELARYFEIIACQQEIDGAVARAVAAQRSWRHVPVDERYARLFKRALAGELSAQAPPETPMSGKCPGAAEFGVE